MLRAEQLKQVVKQRYGQTAAAIRNNARGGCCGEGPSGSGAIAVEGGANCGIPTAAAYDPRELAALPQQAVAASLGCANPVALAVPRLGETVLDLGSGGGIDVLLTARRVGPTGKVYGLDMTDEMLELARENQRKSGVENVEFLEGDIENIPLPDAHVDLIISNCVINLAVDKDKVFREAFRVLKPGGRLAVADLVYTGQSTSPALSSDVDMDGWASCVDGALHEEEFVAKLRASGFEDVEVQIVTEPALSDGCCSGSGGTTSARARLVSAFVRATRP